MASAGNNHELAEDRRWSASESLMQIEHRTIPREGPDGTAIVTQSHARQTLGAVRSEPGQNLLFGFHFRLRPPESPCFKPKKESELDRCFRIRSREAVPIQAQSFVLRITSRSRSGNTTIYGTVGRIPIPDVASAVT